MSSIENGLSEEWDFMFSLIKYKIGGGRSFEWLTNHSSGGLLLCPALHQWRDEDKNSDRWYYTVTPIVMSKIQL